MSYNNDNLGEILQIVNLDFNLKEGICDALNIFKKELSKMPNFKLNKSFQYRDTIKYQGVNAPTITCPHCKHQIDRSFGWLEDNREFICFGCKKIKFIINIIV